MLKFRLGCYKSYPLTRISSRDSGLASKEIRIGLEFKNGVSHQSSRIHEHLEADQTDPQYGAVDTCS